MLVGWVRRIFGVAGRGVDPDGMSRTTQGTRRRCTECRCWYHPETRTGTRQRVCSEGCRRSRRAGQQRRRRMESVEEHRDDERERKRESRARAAPRACPEGQVSPEAASSEVMSLADLRDEVLEKIEETLRFWDERERQSLAGLRRQVSGIIGHCLGDLRHGGCAVVPRSLADRTLQEGKTTGESDPILRQPPGPVTDQHGQHEQPGAHRRRGDQTPGPPAGVAP